MIEKVITCPRCGYQYLPAEIYVPNSFFGSPKYIKRNISGEIQSVSGKEPDYTETYKCDNCNTSFKVLANIEFDVQIDNITDTEYPHETVLR